MTDKEWQPEYIITKKQLEILSYEGLETLAYKREREKVLCEIRSCPVSAAYEPTSESQPEDPWKDCRKIVGCTESWCEWPCAAWVKYHDASIARAATLAAEKRVLDELGIRCYGKFNSKSRACEICQVGIACERRSQQQESEPE
jgi:hypothetical protein